MDTVQFDPSKPFTVVSPGAQPNAAPAQQPMPQMAQPQQPQAPAPLMPSATQPLPASATPNLAAKSQPQQPQQQPFIPTPTVESANAAAAQQPRQQVQFDPSKPFTVVDPGGQKPPQYPMGTLKGTAKSLLDIPIAGPLMQKGLAELDQHGVGLGYGKDYESSLAEQKAEMDQFSQEHPWLHAAGSIGGTAAAVTAGAAAGGIGPALLGLTDFGFGLPGLVAGGAASGAGIGGIDTALRGGDADEIKKSMMINAATGAVLPIGTALAGRAWQGLKNEWKGGNVGGPDAANTLPFEFSKMNPNVADETGVVTPSQMTRDQPGQQFDSLALHGNFGPEGQRTAQAIKNFQDLKNNAVQQGLGQVMNTQGSNMLSGNDVDSAGNALNVIQAIARNEKQNSQTFYDAAAKTPGIFNATGMNKAGQQTNLGFDNIGSKLRARMYLPNPGEQPSVVDDVATPITTRALGMLDDTLGKLRIQNFADPTAKGGWQDVTGGVAMGQLDQVRKQLQVWARAAQPGSPDKMMMGRLIQAFDGHIADAMHEGLFSGDPNAVNYVLNGRSAYAQYMKDFTQQTGDQGVGNIMSKIVGRNGFEGATPNQLANWLYGAGLTGNGGNVALANRMKQILSRTPEGQQSWDQLRYGFWQRLTTKPDGTPLEPQMAYKVLSNFMGRGGQSFMQTMYPEPAIQQWIGRYAQLMKMQIPMAGAVNTSGTSGAIGMMVRQALAHVAAMLTATSVVGPMGAFAAPFMGHMLNVGADKIGQRGMEGTIARHMLFSKAHLDADKMFALQMGRYGSKAARALTYQSGP